ncbi:MAG: polyribonucleotide nucleotidyltransferase [Holosporales bacterium]|nr:polyribonucleotide nucleotidyltransferase [Holosporales bacterium]
MSSISRRELVWGGKKLVFETGKLACQATGSVVVTYGETTLLCTAVAENKSTDGVDFFPLTVNYQEKTFSVGKIPGGFFKREGRPSEYETLVSRLVDRPIRPLFPKAFRNETQVVCTVLSYDQENEPDIVAILGASAALTLSGIPFCGPVGAARVGYRNGEFLLNPTLSREDSLDLDLVVAGTTQGVLMVESEANELSEEKMLEAVLFGHQAYQPVIEAIIGLAEEAAAAPWILATDTSPEKEQLDQEVSRHATKDLLEIMGAALPKKERNKKIKALRDEICTQFESERVSNEAICKSFEDLQYQLLRSEILTHKKRLGGRVPQEIRPISTEVSILPRTHGSALFVRGETQALVVTTLGTGQDEQIIDGLGREYREHFIMHYNFPSFSVGEVGRMGSPGRREVGHGKLAWRALHPILPSKDDFPYTIRVVSEIVSCNGSSSMASVCGASLALMDAGVPLKRPVAGIAMGLVKEGDKFVILSDIQGEEDHLGDMDFKVAGTAEGITALQMDIKIAGVTPEIMKQALEQARKGRLHILEKMKVSLSHSREDLNANAPRIVSFMVPRDKIREVIGTGGKVIREITEKTGAKVDIEDDGSVRVASQNKEALDAAVKWIKSIACDPEVGDIHTGKVVKIMEFGAFVNFWGNRDGLVHISELAYVRPNKVTDVVQEGDSVRVKVVGFDDRGRVKLSIKAALEKSEEIK